MARPKRLYVLGGPGGRISHCKAALEREGQATGQNVYPINRHGRAIGASTPRLGRALLREGEARTPRHLQPIAGGRA